MKKNVVSMLLVISMVASMAVGCGSSEPEGEVVNTETGNFNEFGWEIPEETLVIDVLDVTGYDAPTEADKIGRENAYNYLLENFNVQVNMQYTSGDGNEAVNLALASGDYPDVIANMSYDNMKKFEQANKLAEITPYMDTIAADLKKSMGENYPLFLNDEEKLFYVPRFMGNIIELPDNSAHIRYDEWQAIGAPEIETPEDYYNAINDILEMFPTTPTGETRYAMSFYNDPNFYSDPNVFAGFWGLQNGYKIDEDGNFTHWGFTDEGYDMMKWFNQFYLDGTLDPDAFANTREQWTAKFSNERVVGAVGPWWVSANAGHEVWQTTQTDLPEDKRFIQIGFKADGVDTAYLSPKNGLGSSCTVITDKAADVEGILKFINFQATEKGRALTCWGIPNGTEIGETGEEGKFWNIDEEGNWEVAPEAKEKLITETWNYDDEAYWASMPWLHVNQSRWDDGVHNIWPNQMWYEENKWKSIMIENLDGTIYDSSAMTLRDKDNTSQVLLQSVTDAWKVNWPIIVQSDSDEEFEAAWEQLQASLTAAGIEEYESILQENYIANLEKLENAE